MGSSDDLRPRIGQTFGSAESGQPIEQQRDYLGEGQRQQRPVEGAAFVIDPLLGVFSALDLDPCLRGGALVSRRTRRGRGPARHPGPRRLSPFR